MLAVLGKNPPENDQDKCYTFFLMCVSVEYLTDMEKTHKPEKRKSQVFPSLFPSLPLRMT